MNTTNKINQMKTVAPLYLSALLIPCAITGTLLMMYNSGMGNMFPFTLTLYRVLLSGIAGLCFMIYLKNSEQHPNLSGMWSVLASVSYGLCSHALLPTTKYSPQIIFAMLPLLILTFEAFLYHQQTKFFVIILSIALFVDPITTSGLMLGFVCAFFFFTRQKKGALIADFCHLLLLYVLSVCISAAVSLPVYKAQFELAATQTYSGFSLAQPFSNFISRFLPGAIPTLYYSFSRNINLYFGLFFFFIFVLYFFHNGIARKERLKTLGFVCVILCAIEFSPLRYIFELFTEPSGTSVYFECLFIFIAIKLATKVLPSLSEIKGKNITLGMLCSILILLYGYAGSYLNFHSTSIMSALVFALLYIICILCLWKQVRVSFVEMLLCMFILIELLCNDYLITNQNIFPTDPVAGNSYVWAHFSSSESTDDPLTSEGNSASDSLSATYQSLESQFEEYAATHTDTALMTLVNTLLSEVELTKADYEAYNPYTQLNLMEQANAACRKIGTSGDLFLPADSEISFPVSDFYQITPQGGGVYNLYQNTCVEDFPTTYINFEFTPDRNGTVVLYNNLSSSLYSFDSCQPEKNLTAFILAPATTNCAFNFRLLGYYLNTEVHAEISDLLTAYNTKQITENSSMSIYYWSIAFTCVGVLILLTLYFNRDKDRLLSPLYNLKNRMMSLTLWDRIGRYISSNYVYVLAFIIPVALYLLTMIVFSCIPFGGNSFYDEDGIGSSLPAILGAYYNIQDGNTIYSMNGGYGYSLYTMNTTYFTQAIFNLLPLEWIAPLVLFLVGIAYGLTSLSIVYYLTHRLSGTRAHKKDYRLLIPAFIYTLNTYMLACHNFHTWYYIFVALPLILLAMDYLMYKKTWGLYVLALGICMFTTIHVSLFVCFFLVIHFFTYRFESIKDFFLKGIRFAFFSLLTASCNFFMIFETLNSKSNSFYQEFDNVLPTFGFHTSFFDQWKQLFIFTESMAVNPDEGHINLYMGIFTLILLGLYITSKRITLAEKLKKLVPITILTISFNEQVLSYIWNGFHYQSSVPNRYVFLLMFLCATISYDVIRELKRVSLGRHAGICGLLMLFLILCHIFDENTTFAFVSTLILVVVYALFHILYKKLLRQKMPYYKVVTALLLLELSANMFFTTSNYALTGYVFIDSFEEVQEYASTKLDTVNTPGRVSTPSTFQINTGTIYNVPSGSFFNSFVSAYQCRLHTFYGFLSGSNYTTYNHNSTPLGLALSGHKYIFLPIYASNTLPDTLQYNYLGSCANCYIYENPNVLSLGMYAPSDIRNLQSLSTSTPFFHNELVALYTPDDAPIYNIQPLTYVPDIMHTTNTYTYLDRDKNEMTLEQAESILTENSANVMFPIRDLYLRLYFTPNATGMNYLYRDEFIPLAFGSEGTPLLIDNILPHYTPNLSAPLLLMTFNETTFEHFMEKASQNQMEEVRIDNNRIYGVTRYENDGYTMLSIPFDSNWHAYVDGNEVEIECPFDSFMIFKTPAGEHNIELVYNHAGMKIGVPISIGCTLFTVLLYILTRVKRKNK